MGQMGHMRRTSFSDAKAHLSELVDAAEHRGASVLILRHGKPAAAIVPVNVVAPQSARRRSAAAIAALFDALGDGDGTSAVDDLIEGRR